MKRELRGGCLWAFVAFGICVAAPATNARQAQQTAQRRSRPYALTCPQHDYMLQDFNTGKTRVISPDRLKRAVLARDGSLRILSAGRQLGIINLPEISADLSVIWSPDSENLGITYSDGGATGAFHAHVYRLMGSRVIELSKPVQAAFDDFKREHYCKTRGNNEYVLGWPAIPNTVFVVAEVYPTSDCGPDMGRAWGYLMGFDGRILRRYSNTMTQGLTNDCEKSGRAFVR